MANDPMTWLDLDGIEAEAGDTSPHYLPRLIAEIRKLRCEMERLRRWLWLNHGCSAAVLYGDDGEMQCNAAVNHPGCVPLDFKRNELIRLVVAANNGAERRGKITATDYGVSETVIDAVCKEHTHG